MLGDSIQAQHSSGTHGGGGDEVQQEYVDKKAANTIKYWNISGSTRNIGDKSGAYHFLLGKL